jgi:putative ABC transport system substrate-binding protein
VDRRRFLLTSLAGVLGAPLAAGADKGGKVYRIGFLTASSLPLPDQRDAFEHALRERGWVSGKNLLITYSSADGNFERLPTLAAQLLKVEPRVIVATPTVAVRAASDATRTIPIVMLFVSDPVSEGFVANFARPGGNVTGVTLAPTREIFGKQLQLLKEAVPRARRIAFLWNAALRIRTQPPATKIVENAAQSLGVELQTFGVRSPNDFESAFQAITKAAADALLVAPDAMLFTHRIDLANLAVTHRLPSMYGLGGHANAGGLMTYGQNLTEGFRRAAGYVDRLLRGDNPADLPVEHPTKFELVLNLKTAKALGLTIPPSLLARADQVIQ